MAHSSPLACRLSKKANTPLFAPPSLPASPSPLFSSSRGMSLPTFILIIMMMMMLIAVPVSASPAQYLQQLHGRTVELLTLTTPYDPISRRRFYEAASINGTGGDLVVFTKEMNEVVAAALRTSFFHAPGTDATQPFSECFSATKGAYSCSKAFLRSSPVLNCTERLPKPWTCVQYWVTEGQVADLPLEEVDPDSIWWNGTAVVNGFFTAFPMDYFDNILKYTSQNNVARVLAVDCTGEWRYTEDGAHKILAQHEKTADNTSADELSALNDIFGSQLYESAKKAPFDAIPWWAPVVSDVVLLVALVVMLLCFYLLDYRPRQRAIDTISGGINNVDWDGDVEEGGSGGGGHSKASLDENLPPGMTRSSSAAQGKNSSKKSSISRKPSRSSSTGNMDATAAVYTNNNNNRGRDDVEEEEVRGQPHVKGNATRSAAGKQNKGHNKKSSNSGAVAVPGFTSSSSALSSPAPSARSGSSPGRTNARSPSASQSPAPQLVPALPRTVSSRGTTPSPARRPPSRSTSPTSVSGAPTPPQAAAAAAATPTTLPRQLRRTSSSGSVGGPGPRKTLSVMNSSNGLSCAGSSANGYDHPGPSSTPSSAISSVCRSTPSTQLGSMHVLQRTPSGHGGGSGAFQQPQPQATLFRCGSSHSIGGSGYGGNQIPQMPQMPQQQMMMMMSYPAQQAPNPVAGGYYPSTGAAPVSTAGPAFHTPQMPLQYPGPSAIPSSAKLAAAANAQHGANGSFRVARQGSEAMQRTASWKAQQRQRQLSETPPPTSSSHPADSPGRPLSRSGSNLSTNRAASSCPKNGVAKAVSAFENPLLQRRAMAV